MLLYLGHMGSEEINLGSPLTAKPFLGQRLLGSKLDKSHICSPASGDCLGPWGSQSGTIHWCLLTIMTTLEERKSGL